MRSKERFFRTIASILLSGTALVTEPSKIQLAEFGAPEAPGPRTVEMRRGRGKKGFLARMEGNIAARNTLHPKPHSRHI